jgi:lysozyme family protein
MRSVRDIASDIVTREGGYVNDPDDPGGPTNFGVTLGTLRRLGLDVDQDGDVDIDDVRRLTRDHAVDIFVNHYFVSPGIAGLPAILHETVFDMHVHSGGNAVRILQALFQKMGLEISVDGVIGPQSLAVAAQAAQMAPDHLADAYGIERRNFYYRLADNRVASRKYARRRDGGKGGWIIRAEEFIAPRYHFSHQDHQNRIASWA